jgi:AAA15 family ATPase/GTPase
MLIEFRVGNYKSFKDIVTFSMVASTIKEHPDDNIFSVFNDRLRLLKSGVIYGPNASGKSNLLEAMGCMKHFIKVSSRETNIGNKINVERFRLSSETDNKPSFFEITFIQEGTKYRYGFEVDQEKVHSEWLFSSPRNKERRLFTRDGKDFTIGTHFKEGKKFKDLTRENALLLSVSAQFNGEISKTIYEWFLKFNIISGLQDNYSGFSIEKLDDKDFKDKILNLLNIADIGINGIEKRKYIQKLELLPEELKKIFAPDVIGKKAEQIEAVSLHSLHKKYNKKKEVSAYEEFDFWINESHGTQKLFNLSGPILDTLEHGQILIIDELDARLHPELTQNIIKLFNSHKNSKNAQLIFATHDISLLRKEFFRRDQIWFTEKDSYGVTDLYSLAEYKLPKTKGKVRNDASYARDYMLGKYGAVPYTGNFDFFFEDINA